ncbi:MAG: ATP-binding domain-containing protein, partial [Silvibacterium sp.]|nr:ATP-binding domain-containing protein [Silvibacterium sp.]
VIKPYGESSNPDKDKYIFEDDCLTLATVEAAKGYDSPIVFLMGADLFGETVESRARFYVGATRAKMHLFVTGIRGQGFAEEAVAVSNLLASSVSPAINTPPVVTVDHAKTPENPLPSKTSIPVRSTRKEIQAPSRAATPSAPLLQAFTPSFRRGAAVQHPRYGAGRVVQDGVRKYLSSQDRWEEDVRVQFGGTIKKLEAGSDGLVLIDQESAPSNPDRGCI